MSMYLTMVPRYLGHSSASTSIKRSFIQTVPLMSVHLRGSLSVGEYESKFTVLSPLMFGVVFPIALLPFFI